MALTGPPPDGFVWDPPRGLTYNGISRAQPDVIKTWCSHPPAPDDITSHHTNPMHQAPAVWWNAQTQLYGLAYVLPLGADPIREAILQFSKKIRTMNPFEPLEKMVAIEARLQPSVAPQNGVNIQPLTNHSTQNFSSTPSNATLIRTNSNDSSQVPSRATQYTPYTSPARKDLKRKDRPESSDDDSAQSPVLKLRRMNDIQTFETASPANTQPHLTFGSAVSPNPSSYEIVRNQWLKLRSFLPPPLPKVEISMVASHCQKCKKPLRACSCQVCEVCWKIEEECECGHCDICQELPCTCTICTECGEKICTTTGKYCSCYCEDCKSKYPVIAADFTDKLCECAMSMKEIMEKRLRLLRALKERQSESIQNEIRMLTQQLSPVTVPGAFHANLKDAPTTTTGPKALDEIAGVYDLHWNDFKEQLSDRPQLVIEVEGGVAWACCMWNMNILSMLRMENIPTQTSTLPIVCHVAHPKKSTSGGDDDDDDNDEEWSFENIELSNQTTLGSAYVGGIVVLGDSLLFLGHSVVGLPRAANYPTAIFALKKAAVFEPEMNGLGSGLSIAPLDPQIDSQKAIKKEPHIVEEPASHDFFDPRINEIKIESENVASSSSFSSRIEDEKEEEEEEEEENPNNTESTSAIRKLWNLKHEKYCNCGHNDEMKAANAHGWDRISLRHGIEWDEDFVDDAVAKLLLDPAAC